MTDNPTEDCRMDEGAVEERGVGHGHRHGQRATRMDGETGDDHRILSDTTSYRLPEMTTCVIQTVAASASPHAKFAQTRHLPNKCSDFPSFLFDHHHLQSRRTHAYTLHDTTFNLRDVAVVWRLLCHPSPLRHSLFLAGSHLSETILRFQ